MNPLRLGFASNCNTFFDVMNNTDMRSSNCCGEVRNTAVNRVLSTMKPPLQPHEHLLIQFSQSYHFLTKASHLS